MSSLVSYSVPCKMLDVRLHMLDVRGGCSFSFVINDNIEKGGVNPPVILVVNQHQHHQHHQ